MPRQISISSDQYGNNASSPWATLTPPLSGRSPPQMSCNGGMISSPCLPSFAFSRGTKHHQRERRLVYGSLQYVYKVPAPLHKLSMRLETEFAATLPFPEGEEAPSTCLQLVSYFLRYITSKIAPSVQDPLALRQFLRLLLRNFEQKLLCGKDIHTVAANLPVRESLKLAVIEAYYTASASANTDAPLTTPTIKKAALLNAHHQGKASIYAICGGQGNYQGHECLEELRTLYSTYPTFVSDLITSTSKHLHRLCRSSGLEQIYHSGLDILSWLQNKELEPDSAYLASAPVSFPLIGLVQLAHYTIACSVLKTSPGEMRQHFKGVTGHSQGIVTAAVIAAANSWRKLDELIYIALTLLFWVGARSQEAYPETPLSSDITQDVLDHDEGRPSAMLSVRGLSASALQNLTVATNQNLPPHQQIDIALVNGPRDYVVAGPPLSLYALSVKLRAVKTTMGLEQIRIPFSQRKLDVVHRFLPITAPFHTKYLEDAVTRLQDDLATVKISRKDLVIPVFSTFDGQDLRLSEEENCVLDLVKLIVNMPVHWPKATVFPKCTHILDFGPGSVVGQLTRGNKKSTGVRVLVASVLTGKSPDLGYKSELFENTESSIQYNSNWSTEYAPTLIKYTNNSPTIPTKMSLTLKAPPVTVARMTHWDFVAGAINAGYRIELAVGGYSNPGGMIRPIRKLENAIIPGHGISKNDIYINPRAIAWQSPIIRKLKSKGTPVEGLTIGVGITSPDVVNEYIRILSLDHIGFKLSSVNAIQAVIDIAKENPAVALFLQGIVDRCGGHHSEDLHQTILAMYSKIKSCENIVLVAGRGFGGAEDMYLYVIGQWSEAYGVARMPFDGVLFGSRIMTTKETHSSPAAKKAAFENTFERRAEKSIHLTVHSAIEEAALKSKKWLHLQEVTESLVGKTLSFELQNFNRYYKKAVYSFIKTSGLVFAHGKQISTVDYRKEGYLLGNPVTAYLKRVGFTEIIFNLEQPIPFDHGLQLSFRAPPCKEVYARCSGDYNPIHASQIVADYAELPGKLTQGMQTGARARAILETHAVDSDPKRIRFYSTNFAGMVLPGNEILLNIQYTGMTSNGHKHIKIGKNIPNLTAKPLEISKKEVERPTGSVEIWKALEQWKLYENLTEPLRIASCA